MRPATELLRPGLLEGVGVVVAGASSEAEIATAVADGCVALGASASSCELLGESSAELGEEEIEARVDRALENLEGVDFLAVDGAGLFDARAGGREALGGCLDLTWGVTRAVANKAFIAPQRPGRIVFVAPPAGDEAARHGEAARAGLENLARTLSIEWARYGIAPVAIAPGASTEVGEVAAVIAYLASPAGDYFSGTLLDLRGAGGR